MVNKRNIFHFLITLAFGAVLFLNACSNDELPEPMEPECADPLTYTQHLQPIINASCAFVGCHDSGGTAPGDFTSYASMKSRLDNGMIENRVLTQMNMPIAPGALSAADREQFKCWIEQGHPE